MDGVFDRTAFGPCPTYDEVFAQLGLEDEDHDPCEVANFRIEPSDAGRPTTYRCGSAVILAPADDGPGVAAYSDRPGYTIIKCDAEGLPIWQASAGYGCIMAVFVTCGDPASFDAAVGDSLRRWCEDTADYRPPPPPPT